MSYYHIKSKNTSNGWLTGKLYGKYPITKDGKLVGIGRKFIVKSIFILKFASADQEAYADDLTKQGYSLNVFGSLNRETKVMMVKSMHKETGLRKYIGSRMKLRKLSNIREDKRDSDLNDDCFTGAHRSGDAKVQGLEEVSRMIGKPKVRRVPKKIK